MRAHVLAFVIGIGTVCLPCGLAYAQVDMSGEWAVRLHEDQPWRGPGQQIGEFQGLPINAEARVKAESWNASVYTLPEKQEGGTFIVPGHGRICDEADVVEYRDMVVIIRDRVQDLVSKGRSLDQIKAATVTFDYDRRYSRSEWTGAQFVESVVATLMPPSAPRSH
jgi:hypothetical protein